MTRFSSRPRTNTTTITIPIRYLTNVLGLPTRYIGRVSRGQLADAIGKAKSGRAIDSGGHYGLRRTHSQLAHSQGEDQGEIERRRSSRIEVRGKRDSRSPVDESTRWCLFLFTKEEHGAWK